MCCRVRVKFCVSICVTICNKALWAFSSHCHNSNMIGRLASCAIVYSIRNYTIAWSLKCIFMVK
jgi:hypothetical protein